jgi:Uma2 family endonuclease
MSQRRVVDVLEIPLSDLLDASPTSEFKVVGENLVETRYAPAEGEEGRPVSVLSAWVEGQVYSKLRAYADAGGRGWVWGPSQIYRIFRWDPTKSARPDASFVAAARIPIGFFERGESDIPPDLAVEVLSPDDRAVAVNRKVRDYLRAGVRMVWVIDPEIRTVLIHREGAAVTGVGDAETLSGGDVLPGFSCKVADLFPSLPPAPAATASAAPPSANPQPPSR